MVDNNQGRAVLAYYGLCQQVVEAAGGRITGAGPNERKTFDVVIHGGTLGNAPEFNVWYEMSQRFDLKYLRLTDELLDKLAKEEL